MMKKLPRAGIYQLRICLRVQTYVLFSLDLREREVHPARVCNTVYVPLGEWSQLV